MQDTEPTRQTVVNDLCKFMLDHPSRGLHLAANYNSKLPSEFVASTHRIDCRGSDSGAETCTRTCASDHLGLLRAFHITGMGVPPSPPPPAPPPAPPAPPPSPSPPISVFRFNGATDTCFSNGIYRGTECRDGAHLPLTFRSNHSLLHSQSVFCFHRWSKQCMATIVRLR